MRNRFLIIFAFVNGICIHSVGLVPILIISIASFILVHVSQFVYRWWTKPRFPDMELIDKLDAIRMKYFMSFGKIEIKPKGTEKQRQKQLVKQFKKLYRAFYEQILKPLKKANIDLFYDDAYIIDSGGNLVINASKVYIYINWERWVPFCWSIPSKKSDWLTMIQTWPKFLEKVRKEYADRLNFRQQKLLDAEAAMRDMEQSS